MHSLMLKYNNVEPFQWPGYLLTLDIFLVLSDWISSMVCYLVSLGLSHFAFCFISTEYGFFNLPLGFLIYAFVFGVSVDNAGNW